MLRRHCDRLTLCCLVFGLSAIVGSVRGADGPVASDPLFRSLAIDGATVSGRLSQFEPNGDVSLVSDNGEKHLVPVQTLVKLTREGPVPPISPEASVVLFPDGDRLYRTAIGAATDTALDVQSFSLGHLNVPLDSLLGLVLALPTDSDALDGLLLKVRDEPRKKESVWLSNGDQLTGGFLR